MSETATIVHISVQIGSAGASRARAQVEPLDGFLRFYGSNGVLPCKEVPFGVKTIDDFVCGMYEVLVPALHTCPGMLPKPPKSGREYRQFQAKMPK